MSLKEPLRKSLTMGLLCAGVGAVSGVVLLATATGSGYAWFLVAAPAAAFLTGTAFWWLFVARGARFSTTRGALTGAGAGAVAHFVCWYLLLVGAATCHALTGGCTDSLGGTPMNPLQAAGAAGIYSAASLFFLGWLTVPAGALIGGLLARAQRRRLRDLAVRHSLPDA